MYDTEIDRIDLLNNAKGKGKKLTEEEIKAHKNG